jgi:hypothetical protein
VNPNSLLVDPFELGPVADTLRGRQGLAAHASLAGGRITVRPRQ